jgi:hypothetical protein
LYSSTVIRVIVMAYSTIRRDKKCIQFISGNLKGRDHFGNLGIDWRIILRWILNK